MASVSFDNVEKAYGSTKVIHGVGFDIHDGEFMRFRSKNPATNQVVVGCDAPATQSPDGAACDGAAIFIRNGKLARVLGNDVSQHGQAARIDRWVPVYKNVAASFCVRLHCTAFDCNSEGART